MVREEPETASKNDYLIFVRRLRSVGGLNTKVKTWTIVAIAAAVVVAVLGVALVVPGFYSSVA